MRLAAKQALVLGERIFDLDISGQHRCDVPDAHALGRLAFRDQKVPNTVLRHDPRRFLCQCAPQVVRSRWIVSAHLGTIQLKGNQKIGSELCAPPSAPCATEPSLPAGRWSAMNVSMKPSGFSAPTRAPVRDDTRS